MLSKHRMRKNLHFGLNVSTISFSLSPKSNDMSTPYLHPGAIIYFCCVSSSLARFAFVFRINFSLLRRNKSPFQVSLVARQTQFPNSIISYNVHWFGVGRGIFTNMRTFFPHSICVSLLLSAPSLSSLKTTIKRSPNALPLHGNAFTSPKQYNQLGTIFSRAIVFELASNSTEKWNVKCHKCHCYAGCLKLT